MNEGSHISLHYRGGCSSTCTECTFRVVLIKTWARSHAEAVERDLLVVYPVIDIRAYFKAM